MRPLVPPLARLGALFLVPSRLTPRQAAFLPFSSLPPSVSDSSVGCCLPPLRSTRSALPSSFLPSCSRLR
ncbi:hypothetical protein PF005_g28600 [Phytophthora fragariae]|uniref:Uncharacterized protein n=1 Tax=Phytophthora fragariae TaxID=53985 RepID=A0A6A3VIX4_9STRA|nr:hypothetical protein PF005_g28600 [Phytophthora fragariae]